ncbi:HIT domain-containing protein [Candidatus Nitrosacidococcus sp. I8]|uniref:HIT domain-containing protein n=1 Tax=Candidatus Nitrosacidococcus sp. I8 TaxID=2942908 RepID=UPI002227147A|nr:HIT domain-containing protein [Candidatus Nitrosacidococcus sp. I8]CAH9019876.1 Purine nucleoside phosphoramidase [Candidatus Nitrosacidococcus sp. I8]
MKDPECIFCKIINKEISADIVYKDKMVVVFRDIQPRAKVHLLLIPHLHIPSLEQLEQEHQNLIRHMILLLPKLAHSQGLNTGFRTIINTGPAGGQEINHLHIHLLGGDSIE